MVESGMLAKIRQLAIKINFLVNSTLEECRENVKIIRAIEDYGFVRFSSRFFVFSHDLHLGMGIDDYLSYDLAWFNPYSKNI